MILRYFAETLLGHIAPLVKEIKSRAGQVHFRRWAFAENKHFALYLHNIRRADEDADPHDHPWDFVSFVLRGGYDEFVLGPDGPYAARRKPFRFVYHPTTDFHRVTQLLTGSSWTLVLTGPRKHEPWGYHTDTGWVDHVTYRKRKNARLGRNDDA